MKSYGAWAGNPKGNPEDPDRCIESVSDGYLFYQCKRKRGYGPDGLYCKQHAKQHFEGRWPHSITNTEG